VTGFQFKFSVTTGLSRSAPAINVRSLLDTAGAEAWFQYYGQLSDVFNIGKRHVSNIVFCCFLPACRLSADQLPFHVEICSEVSIFWRHVYVSFLCRALVLRIGFTISVYVPHLLSASISDKSRIRVNHNVSVNLARIKRSGYMTGLAGSVS